jgi:hypothetical protein
MAREVKPEVVTATEGLLAVLGRLMLRATSRMVAAVTEAAVAEPREAVERVVWRAVEGPVEGTVPGAAVVAAALAAARAWPFLIVRALFNIVSIDTLTSFLPLAQLREIALMRRADWRRRGEGRTMHSESDVPLSLLEREDRKNPLWVGKREKRKKEVSKD